MSRLTPELVVLDKGLDLQVAKLVAPPGSVYDSLNYEQVDFQGQKRIDGFVRYDGTVLSAMYEFYLVSGADVRAQDIAYNDDVPYGVRVGTLSIYDVIAAFNEVALPDTAIPGASYFVDPEEHYAFVLEYNLVLRDKVGILPGAISGLHWFRDRLYAVADAKVLVVNSSINILPNDVLTSSGNTFTAIDRIFVGGITYVLTDALFSVSGFTVTRTGATHTVAQQLAGWKGSFYESVTEQQDIDAGGNGDARWVFKHQGWALPFTDGTSAYGELTSLNQNRQGVGVQGPTSIAGESGRPLLLLQKVSIAGEAPQVNGWKTSTSPSVYNLEVEALNEIDGYYIYADAFVSWEEESSSVNTPGITGVGLVEYPANNNVAVEV